MPYHRQSHLDLFALAKAGLLRLNLPSGLDVLTLNLPPLRHRREDIALLVQKFLDRFNAGSEGPPNSLHPDSRGVLTAYDWPGNIRKLEQLIHREFIRADGPLIETVLPQQSVANAWAPTASVGRGSRL